MRFDYLPLAAFAALMLACGGERGAEEASVATESREAPAAESPAPAAVALLQPGTLSGWHAYGGGAPGAAWSVDPEGVLHFDPSITGDDGETLGGDIVTDAAYDDYELELEWRIGPCGNSGIIYNVIERDDLAYPWLSGPEMQVLDDSCHPDAKIYTHRAGDLYDMIAGDSTAVKPAGQWNAVRLVVTDGHVEHWLNGRKVVEYDNTGDAWRERIADSKFADFGEQFGSVTGGHIALQDHGDPVWYREVRVRSL